ncbi:hypothetical protein ERJ75_001419000 [Trypanosoma vivax]|uniref:Uncharacterized protein n=1 Tax=Trypanosoma vivax (strain Y486) TaxID=1055687 RepID=G0TUJ4_TRYVY|nr:hypothetical protein TRVL_03709 [Trypanosoma vivax]KAH8607454.1 hypothetical protein ERJ75_001419000 [Trypanosoma vivax]CCC47628.1 conserved hypothetical protein [Trypanosoma vivax Y486]
MLRHTQRRYLLNISGESPSFRAKPLRNLQMDVQMSPYKEQFKDYWSTPVPWADREYGEKPKLGAPIPTRRAATTVVIGKNRHIDDAKVQRGEDNDYKVLMMFREGKNRLVRDQFILPSLPVSLEDSSEDWEKILRRRELKTQWADLHHRLCAMRALFAHMNILLIPKEGGGLVEVEGPPGPKKWHLLVHSNPKAMKNLVDVLELPMETTLSQLLPFRTIVTPTTETFRFSNLSYLVVFEKIPDVRFTISTLGEKLVWVSPMEAIARFNAGIMNMPTPNLILLSELNNECPTFAEVCKRKPHDSHRTVLPELFRHDQTKVATVLLPGDLRHPDTTQEDKMQQFVRRFVYEKDYPFGVRAVFEERQATTEEVSEPLIQEAPKLLEEANEMDMVYADIPYPKREKKPEEIGRTIFKVPEHTFREGAENEEGVIPVKTRNIGSVGDLYSHTK